MQLQEAVRQEQEAVCNLEFLRHADLQRMAHSLAAQRSCETGVEAKVIGKPATCSGTAIGRSAGAQVRQLHGRGFWAE